MPLRLEDLEEQGATISFLNEGRVLDKYKIHADTLSEEAKRDQEGHLLRFAISKTAIYFRI